MAMRKFPAFPTILFGVLEHAGLLQRLIQSVLAAAKSTGSLIASIPRSGSR